MSTWKFACGWKHVGSPCGSLGTGGHGMTGTALGDPIEVGAQEKIYGKDAGNR